MGGVGPGGSAWVIPGSDPTPWSGFCRQFSPVCCCCCCCCWEKAGEACLLAPCSPSLVGYYCVCVGRERPVIRPAWRWDTWWFGLDVHQIKCPGRQTRLRLSARKWRVLRCPAFEGHSAGQGGAAPQERAEREGEGVREGDSRPSPLGLPGWKRTNEPWMDWDGRRRRENRWSN